MRILGTASFTRAPQHLQAWYGGGHITGPGLAGPGFYDSGGGCPA